MAEKTLEKLVFNFSEPIRYDVLEGREYLVVPAVIITEGVHNGSGGPLYYPADELAKTPESWDHKPIVVYHPELNGQPVSACKKDILEKQKVGLMLNTMFDTKLRTEAWLDKLKTEIVDKRIITALETNEMMEVSSGVYTDNELGEGEWNGKKYVAVARNYRPDHLAILPDLIGACSIKDGAGLLQTNKLTVNSKSWGDIASELRTIIEQKFGYSAYLEDVFTGWFVFAYDGGLWKMSYTTSDFATTVEGPATRVFYVSQYKAIDGTVVGNVLNSLKERNKQMDRKTAVDALIANKIWVEGDREWLIGLPNDKFEKLAKKAEEPVKSKEPEVPATNTEKPIPTPAPVPASKKDLTEDEYIAQAPVGMQPMLRNGLNSFKSEKAHHVKTIIANEANVLTEKQLEALDIDVLRGMSRMAKKPEAQEPELQANWFGGGGGAPDSKTEVEIAPLIRPTHNKKAS